ncbi:uncharacterized protein EV420DRAFT_1765081 [Desarmillaria tabescens]|uniref:Uncharacterized protein n=1 Tax=Armillaria tabescens TaxID=1929756 RepID=A0AA39KCC7_ARMTA|nr:uncharacterized protein EV420DRAFT_1765081 [Desarmillaria tabescens]KAK0457365.1 hypothetical protein EV420DRAFT_1765081 [Desarmillaria tabescens]
MPPLSRFTIVSHKPLILTMSPSHISAHYPRKLQEKSSSVLLLLLMSVETEQSLQGQDLGFAATDFNAVAFLGFGLRMNWVDELAAVGTAEDEMGV